MSLLATGWDGAERDAWGRFGQDFGERAFGERSLDAGQGLVETAMQGAQNRPVGRDPERALADSPDRINGIDDLENRQPIGRFRQNKSAMQTALRCDQPRTSQALQDLGKISVRNASDVRNLLCSARLGKLVGEISRGPQCIFDRLGNHKSEALGQFRTSLS